MAEFLQNYGIWIVVGLFSLFMMRGHAHKGGCCGGMGGHEHDQNPTPAEGKEGKEREADSSHESSHH